MADDPLLPPAQAAAVLGVSIDTLRRWANEGRVPYVRTLGRQRRFRRSDLLATLVAGDDDPKAAAAS